MNLLLCTWAGLLLKRVVVFEQLQLSDRQYRQATCFLYVALKVVPWGSDPNSFITSSDLKLPTRKTASPCVDRFGPDKSFLPCLPVRR